MSTSGASPRASSGAVVPRGGAATGDLYVRMLGPAQVEWQGEPLDILRRQSRALLYRLAWRCEAVPRYELCFLFWPNTRDATARRYLTHLLTHLRQALPDPDLIWASGDQVGLDPHHVGSDTHRFEQLCAAAALGRRSTPLGGSPALQAAQSSVEGDGLSLLQQAVDLYQGPFLSGFSLADRLEYETWAEQQRQHLEQLYLEALAALILQYTARADFAAAIDCARLYLAIDELAEDIHSRLMELYGKTGQRAAALRQFEHLSAVLERELGVSPLPETRAIYRSILEERRTTRGTPAATAAWATLPGLHLDLVGRDPALRQLERAYRRVRAGRSQMVLISGEPGSGKSRLMQEFATRRAEQPRLLLGQCALATQRLPYYPISQALRPELDTLCAARTLHPIWLAEACRLLPELRARRPDLPLREAGIEPARPRLFEALYQLVRHLALGPIPCLLCLDDLHWADTATLDWLAFLVRRPRRPRLLIVGTYSAAEGGTIRLLRRGLVGSGLLTEIDLAGLDGSATLHLLRQVAGPARGDEALAERLRSMTGGNPFFLLEMLRALQDASPWPADEQALDDLPLPPALRQAVEARLQGLHAKARQVLEAAAVLGSPFAFEQVRRTAGRRELETMDGLDELVAHGLLEEQGTRYVFRHEVVQRAVLASLSPVREQLLRRRATRTL
jgi:DNA-binding SARP family transcriptional activator